ncbi:hypothetical protein Goklo_018064 [Gossypium klotzschianum]|uniref:Uncharacterized protein n=1 Tax=Gossypium klotzschianum TaxID=34286 RepID=A0A7J8UJS8_9ROSI|nr:hypothetical protein [Gossypium klotzschianum]
MRRLRTGKMHGMMKEKKQRIKELICTISSGRS